MKSIFYTLLGTMLLSAGLANAATVDQDKAVLVARDFLAARGISKNITLSVDRAGISRANTSACSPYYIYNIEGGGYVVVAGDDRARSVLAYSDNGSIDASAVSGPCAMWLDLYDGQIAALSSDDKAELTLFSSDYYPSAPIEPLLSSRWDQNEPYNLQCPVDSRSGLRSATGCVATAAAQIMYYYRYPERPVGTVTYTDNTQGVNRSIDFSTIGSFDWNNMTDTYNSSSTQVQREAVSTLMMAVGYASSMQYGSDVSIAYHRAAGESLARNFVYDSNMHFYERRLFSDAEWVELLYDELRASRPVLYDGKNPSAGHTFVCDGYDGDGRFHFNWGWSGLSDGYFSLSALNPGSQSTGGSASGYTDSQSMVCHIAPAGTAGSRPQTDRLMTIYDLNLGDNTKYYQASQTPELKTSTDYARLFFYSFNNGFEPFDGEVWAVTSVNGVVTPLVQANAFNTISSGGYGPMIFELFKAGLGDGNYIIEFAYRLKGSTEWHPVTTSTGAASGCDVTVSGGQATLVPFMRDPSMLYFRPVGGAGYGVMDVADNSMSVNVTNMGNIAWHGSIYGYVMRRDGTFVPGSLEGEATVTAAGTTVIMKTRGLQFDGTGSYALRFYADPDRNTDLGAINLSVFDSTGGVDDLFVDDIADGSTVIVTGMDGRVYRSLDGLRPGVYIVSVTTGAKTMKNKKIIIR